MASGTPATIDAAAIANLARAAFSGHPATWTSYAELAEAYGLTRRHARVVARALGPEPTHDCWYRIRDKNGVYNVPFDEADPKAFSQAEADRRLRAAGVDVTNQRADPGRKLIWTHGKWVQAGR
jgi:hypothetical protein